MKKFTPKDFVVLLLFIAIPLLVSFVGSLSVMGQIETWYASLNAPSFSPSPSLFAPVWTVLYTLMGISTFLVWKKLEESKEPFIKISMVLFFIHLMFNAAWSPIFFGMENIALGLVDIALVLVLGGFSTYRYFKISKTAGYLLIPYMLWISFATVLNLSYLLLN